MYVLKHPVNMQNKYGISKQAHSGTKNLLHYPGNMLNKHGVSTWIYSETKTLGIAWFPLC
uniref:Uncharacterized protein n=1 Tax=Rhizophora mucronata TaxID=61149 RepID=A0A2P2QU72_RHIMU